MNKPLAFDSTPSARSVDDNGFMHVANSHITKATVNPYYGREIPGWEKAGLDPEKIYYGLRDPRELQKSIGTWEGLPLHIEHHPDSADEPEIRTRVGAVGRAHWANPYIDASLTIWNQQAIDAIEDGSFRELSCAYRYTPDFTPGKYEGVDYDFVMRNIRGNHVALVEEGRAGADVLVADAALDGKEDQEWRTAGNGKKYQIGTETGEITKGNLGHEKKSDAFGPSFTEFKGKPKEAIEHLLQAKNGHVPGAFYKEGLGDIDLPYGKGGKKGFGLAHIIERRNEDGHDGLEFARKLPEVIKEGTIEEREGFPGRKYIVHQKTEAVIRLEWDGAERNWMLTAYPLKGEANDKEIVLTFDDNQKFIFPRRKEKDVSDGHGKFSQDTCLRKSSLVFSRHDLGAETSKKIINKILPNVNPERGGIMKGIKKGLKKIFRGAKDANPDIERAEVDLAQSILDLHKVDPNTGEIVDITEDEDKAEEIRKIVGEISGKLEPEEIKKLNDALAGLAYSKATGDEEPKKEGGMDEKMKSAMDACGLDSDDEDMSKAFAAGVEYSEKLEKSPEEREKLDREHESNGLKSAMDACGLDAENPQESRAFAEGVKYGEKLERNPEERKKLDEEHESEGAKEALDEDKNAEIAKILAEVPDLTDAQKKQLTASLQDLAYTKSTGYEDMPAQDRALRKKPKTPRPLMASDAAIIRAQAVADAQNNMRRVAKAIGEVRPLVGDLDMMAFDSASDVYGYTLEQCGVDKRKYEKAAWRGMVDMLRREKCGLGDKRMAQDARPVKLEGPFAGLASISVGD